MTYSSGGETLQSVGLAYTGEVYQTMDGHLYEWVDGVDASGEPAGVWQRLSEPDGPVFNGLGALYAAPDGTVYQVQGLGDAEPVQGPANLPRRRPRPVPHGLPASGHRSRGSTYPPRRRGGFLKALLPIAKFATRFIPGIGPVVSAGVDVASKLVQGRGVAGNGGLGAFYAAQDGTIYQVQGLAAGLGDLYADDQGVGANDELNGLGDEELRGLYADEELRGVEADEELRGLYADEELRGLEEATVPENAIGSLEAYVREAKAASLDAYVPDEPGQTPWVDSHGSSQVWKPLW